MSEEGKTVVFVLLDDELVGMIALADIVRETAKEAIATLKKNGVHSIMLTGDNKKVADWVAKQLDNEEDDAEVLPNEKSYKVKKIRKDKKRKVAITDVVIYYAHAL